MIRQDRLVEEFMELVQVDSETGHEEEIAEVLKRKFSDLGLSVTEDDSKSRTGHGAGNLIVTMAGTPGVKAPKLFFTCHMDTVAPGKGIQPQLGADGWITSDGTTILGSDDKAGIAVLFEAIKVIQEQNIEHGQIQFVITAGEESGLLGARCMDPKYLDADLGYAIDSNGEIGAIAVAAPTQAKMKMKIFGKSAHAGVNPEDGISAIQVASKAIARMKLGRLDHETTANIGKFAAAAARPTSFAITSKSTRKPAASCRTKSNGKSNICAKRLKAPFRNAARPANLSAKSSTRRSTSTKTTTS